jgi:hypothetical protein
VQPNLSSTEAECLAAIHRHGLGFESLYSILVKILTLSGIVMTLTGIVQNYSGLLAVRFFLGEYLDARNNTTLYLDTNDRHVGLTEAGLCKNPVQGS